MLLINRGGNDMTFALNNLDRTLDYDLMFEDEVVLRFNLKKTYKDINIINDELLPFEMQGLRFPLADFKSWLIQRVLPYNRRGVDKLYETLNKPKTSEGAIDIALKYGALSLTDPYWIRESFTDLQYKDVCLFNVKWDEDFSKLALTEEHLGFGFGSLDKPTPELTLGGAWAKCLVREKLGDDIFLYKASQDYDMEDIKAEVTVTKLLDRLVIPHASYCKVTQFGVKCSKTKLLTNKDTFWVTAGELARGWEYDTLLELGLDSGGDLFKDMIIIDYLVGNIDRHQSNWSFIFDRQNKVIEMAPLYDFNFAFTGNVERRSQFDNEYTDKEVAIKIIKDYNKQDLVESVKSILPELDIPKWHREFIEYKIKGLEGLV